MPHLFRRITHALSESKDLFWGKERFAFFRQAGLFLGKVGLEIGGPSVIFQSKERLPVYTRAARIDGVNFASSTLWDPDIHEGNNYYRYAEDKVGHQFVLEASNLERIANNSYDFVLSSHSLEHSANPLQCLAEWVRVLKPGGALVLVLPDSRFTFDHRRPTTSFQHLLDDYCNSTGEDDLTHLEEILSLHDRTLDPAAGTPEQFRSRSLHNLQNRALHQHVFDSRLVARCFRHLGISLLYEDVAPPHHLIALGVASRSKHR